jgi:short-subunit dehydrogenase
VVIFSLTKQAIISFSEGVTHTVSPAGLNNVYTVTAAGPTDTVTIG